MGQEDRNVALVDDHSSFAIWSCRMTEGAVHGHANASDSEASAAMR